MRFSTMLVPVLAATSVAAQLKGKGGGKGVLAAFAGGRGAGNGRGGNKPGQAGNSAAASQAAGASATASAVPASGSAVANAGAGNSATNGTANTNPGNNQPANNNGGANQGGGATVQTSNTGTPVNALGVNGGEAGGALNAGSTAPNGPNGLPQLANSQPGFDATTNTGGFGPFVPLSAALPQATGAPQTVDAATAQALQAAADNWAFDTSQVSNFLNTGKSLTGQQFNQGANIAYNAEVDELTHKAILDQIIGNDPDVSIANQTLTNGVFQSVVNNLQIMADQGANTQQLIDAISSVRCTQILPSIDTYMAVAARVIGSGATLRTSTRPDTCPQIVQAAPDSAFPGNIQVLQVRANANIGTSNAPAPNANQGSINGQAVPASGPGSNLAGGANNGAQNQQNGGQSSANNQNNGAATTTATAAASNTAASGATTSTAAANAGNGGGRGNAQNGAASNVAGGAAASSAAAAPGNGNGKGNAGGAASANKGKKNSNNNRRTLKAFVA